MTKDDKGIKKNKRTDKTKQTKRNKETKTVTSGQWDKIIRYTTSL